MHIALEKKFHLAVRLGAVALTVAAVAAMLVWPSSDTFSRDDSQLLSANGPSDASQVVEDNSRSSEGRQLSSGDGWYKRRLRTRPTTPVESPKNGSQTKKAARSNQFRLLGTIIEPGHSFAMVEDLKGGIDAQPVGGILKLSPEGYKVEKIAPSEVTLTQVDSKALLRLTAANGKHGIPESNRMNSASPKDSKQSESEEAPGAFSGPPPQGGFKSLMSELEYLNADEPSNRTSSESSQASDTAEKQPTKSAREPSQ